MKQLQEKYLNPVEKIGKPRSHVANLQYGVVTLGDDGKVNLQSAKLG